MVLRRRTESLTGNDARPPSSFIPTTSQYAHVSSYRSLLMEVRVHSPSVKVVGGEKKLVPVFGDGDQVGGTVTLDSTSSPSGRLLFTIEGAFYYHSSDAQEEDSHIKPERRKHIFYSSTSITPVSPSLDSFLSLSNSRSAFRDAFTSTVRPRLKRRPSASSVNAPTSSASGFNRTYPFSFDLPRGYRSGEELPPTFASTSRAAESSRPGSRGNDASSSGSFGVEYKVSVTWEPTDASDYPSFLDIPILYHPDADFQSQDLSSQESSSWLEMPLRSDRPMPFRCAITLPTSVTFSRTSSIPYYVVFTTTPRSPVLAREIATDATISVTLLRKVTVTEQSVLPPTPPETPSSGSDESEGSRGILRLKRVVPSAWSPRNPEESLERDKPLPRLPMHTVFNESRLLHTSICIGFPKRPRQQTGPEKHPSLEDQSALPDGLHKAKFTLNKDMLPSIDWAGVSVKYYVDVSVLIGQDDVRARIPIRIV